MAWFYNNHSGEFHHATNPIDNAAYAALIHEGIGWHEYATEKQMLSSIKAHGWKDPTGSVIGGLGNATGIHNPITDITHFLTNPDTWIRIGEVLAGAILLTAGIVAILKTTSVGEATSKTIATGIKGAAIL
jgi:hypothetical protein